MQQPLFNISDHFSRTLEEVRGPQTPLRRIRAWASPSSARRMFASALPYGVLAIVGSTLGILFYQYSKQTREARHESS